MIKLPAYLTGFSSKSDGSASLRFSTQELSAEDFALLKKYLNAFGWMMFSENQIKHEDIPEAEPVEEWEKTPSQRLRGALYRLWEKSGKKGDKDEHYKQQMEKIIEHIKSKLE